MRRFVTSQPLEHVKSRHRCPRVLSNCIIRAIQLACSLHQDYVRYHFYGEDITFQRASETRSGLSTFRDTTEST